MRLSPNKLAKPNNAASGDVHIGASNLETSFLLMDQEQIQQWEESGVLSRALNGSIGQRKDYPQVLPTLVLRAANMARNLESKITASGGSPYALFEGTWIKLRGMIKQPPSQEMLDQWLSEAASLPLAKELLEEGANPHADLSPSPFVRLLRNYLDLRYLKNRPRPGWGQASQEVSETRAKLLSWIELPGMSPKSATSALNLLVHEALINNPRESDDFLVSLRDSLVSKGAYLNASGLKIFYDASLAKHLQPTRTQYNVLREIDERRTREEEYRTGLVHREKVVAWADALIPCPIEAVNLHQSQWNTSWAWKQWLCLPGSHRFASHLATSALNLWGSGGEPTASDFLNVIEASERPILLTETILLDKALRSANENECMSEQWKERQAAGMLGASALQPLAQVKTLFDWIKPASDRDLPDPLTRALFRSRALFVGREEGSEVQAELSETLHWLNEQGRLDFMIYRQHLNGLVKKDFRPICGHCTEGAEYDRDMVSSEWNTWLQRAPLRDALLTLPEPFPMRVKIMSAFFPLPNDPADQRVAKIEEAIALNPAIQGELRAFMHTCAKRERDPLPEKLMRWQDIALVNRVNITPGMSWHLLAANFTPDLASKFSLSDWRALLDDQQAKVPVSGGSLMMLSNLLELEKKHPLQEWEKIIPLLDELLDLGLALSNLPPVQDQGAFSSAVESMRQEAVLQSITPATEPRRSRPRL